jgi:hypothetical protein
MQQVVVDIRMYLLYLLLMMWGFACAYCVLFRRDQEHEVRFGSYSILQASSATSTVVLTCARSAHISRMTWRLEACTRPAHRQFSSTRNPHTKLARDGISVWC